MRVPKPMRESGPSQKGVDVDAADQRRRGGGSTAGDEIGAWLRRQRGALRRWAPALLLAAAFCLVPTPGIAEARYSLDLGGCAYHVQPPTGWAEHRFSGEVCWRRGSSEMCVKAVSHGQRAARAILERELSRYCPEIKTMRDGRVGYAERMCRVNTPRGPSVIRQFVALCDSAARAVVLQARTDTAGLQAIEASWKSMTVTGR